ncbi:unnamed protein product, partial [Choristocarpus tenellus]
NPSLGVGAGPRLTVPASSTDVIGHPVEVINGLANAVMGEAMCRCGLGLGDFSRGCSVHGLTAVSWAAFSLKTPDNPLPPVSSITPPPLIVDDKFSTVEGVKEQESQGGTKVGAPQSISSVNWVGTADEGLLAEDSVKARRVVMLGLLRALAALSCWPYNLAELARVGRAGRGLGFALTSLLDALCEQLQEFQRRSCRVVKPPMMQSPSECEDVLFFLDCLCPLVKIAARSSPSLEQWHSLLNVTVCPAEAGLNLHPSDRRGCWAGEEVEEGENMSSVTAQGNCCECPDKCVSCTERATYLDNATMSLGCCKGGTGGDARTESGALGGGNEEETTGR